MSAQVRNIFVSFIRPIYTTDGLQALVNVSRELPLVTRNTQPVYVTLHYSSQGFTACFVLT